MEVPLLLPGDPAEPGKEPVQPVQLQNRQTGHKELDETFYAQEVAQLVMQLENQDRADMAQVKKTGGFTENAYRFVFAYEDNFKDGAPPHLQTILPSGKIENEKVLNPEAERGLIAYTYSQKMADKKTADLFKAQGSPFVFDKNGEPYVMQTWPTRFNEKFKKDFTLYKYPNNPDPTHFEVEALEDFKRVALKLFQRSGDEDPPLWLGVRQSENKLPMYEGSGSQLMALLRLRHDIREELSIIKILEPDGFLSKFTDGKNKEGEKPFHMDLNRPYCLYTKQGWETMACVKPLAQFDWEANRYTEQEIPPAPASDDGVISSPLDMEWVSGPAYVWAWRATIVVWGGAFFTVTFAWCFYQRADWLENGPWSDFWQHLANTVTAVTILSVTLFGLYADDKAMSYCLVPWLQNVKENSCRIPFYGPATCSQFRYFSLLCTFSQTLTIPLNAWVLGNTIRNYSGCKTEAAWTWLWKEGGVGFAPLSLVQMVLLFWALSTLQFILPTLYTSTNISSSRATTSINSVDLNRPITITRHSYKLHGKSLLSGSLSEGVTLMALASGMRYTGAVSLSYPLAKIKRIKDEQIGFMLMNEDGSWEQTQHGWQFRCVKELEKLNSVQVKRLWFMLVFKYAFQMNVQVTLFILKGTIQRKEFNYFAAGAELLSLGAMTLGIASEFFDLNTLLWTFWDIRSVVRECIDKKNNKGEENQNNNVNDKKDVDNDGKEDLHARHFFKRGQDHDVEEEDLTFTDLSYEYYRIVVTAVFVVLVTVFAIWLIGYQMLKFLNFWTCPHHVWSFKNGCLSVKDMNDYLDNKCPGKQ